MIAAALLRERERERERERDRHLMLMQPMMAGFSPNSVTADMIQQMAAQRISQTTELDAPGYVHLDTYELKKKHRQLRTILCGRCKLLYHGHIITAVGGNGGYSGGKQFVSTEERREKLSHLRHEKALIVKLGLYKILSYFVLPCFIAESTYKIWWYCSGGSRVIKIFQHSGLYW